MKRILRLKRTYLLSLIPLSLLLLLAARNSSFFAEKIFALHIYKWLSQALSTIIGILPFSVAELVLVTSPLLLLFILARFAIRIIKHKDKRKQFIFRGVLNSLCTLSVIFFMFVIFAGINYYRYPFSHYSNLTITQSSVEELYALTENLAYQANELREMTSGRNQNGEFALTESKYHMAKLADRAMDTLAKSYTVLKGHYAAPKPVLMSEMMSHAEIMGIFIPFTMEANINVHVPDYNIPSTMLHELAHLRGFMREDEANFIAYLAGMESDNAEIRYSSTMLALVVASNALYDQNPDLYFTIRSLYTEGVLKDIRGNSEYWVKYEESVISTVSNKVNDTYLKANNQTDGVKSYGRMLDLMLAKYRKDNGIE